MNKLEQKREELVHKTFTSMFKILIIFGIPAAIGFFVGSFVDAKYDIRPNGSVGVLAVTFILSWIIMIRMYLNITKQFSALREQENAERNITQKMLKDNISSK